MLHPLTDLHSCEEQLMECLPGGMTHISANFTDLGALGVIRQAGVSLEGSMFSFSYKFQVQLSCL